jgi:DNA modification methylase
VNPYYEEAGITIYHGDCRQILPQLGRFDLLLTDPPYGIDACNMTLGAGRKDFVRGDWDGTMPDIKTLPSIATHACIWGGNYFTEMLPPTNDWLIWHKLNDGRSFSECEMAWTNFGKQTRHLSHHWSGEIKQHPTQKPLAVMRWAILQAPDGIKTVIDPFMGSGTSLKAAKDEGLRAVGIEVLEAYCEIAANRLRQSVLNFEPVEAGTP